MILQPQVAFPIVRQIANHTDSTVYYVRAVVRNAQGTTIDTVDLVSQGDQRYQTSWQVPADPSGQGSYISIVTSVYTDAGYSTKSENYGDEETTYLVFDRVTPAMRGGVGGGIDSRTVRRIIREELDKQEKPKEIEFPEQETVDLTPIVSELSVIKEKIDALPKPVKTDLLPIEKALTRVAKELSDKIDAKEVTPETDLSPILDKLTEDKEDTDLSAREVKSMLDTAKKEIIKFVPDTVIKRMEGMQFRAKTIEMEVEEERENYKFDLSRLS